MMILMPIRLGHPDDDELDEFETLDATTGPGGGEMNRDEAAGSREVDELIKEVVRVAMNKL